MLRESILILSLAVLVSSSAHAFSVSPLRLVIDTDNRMKVIHIENPRSIPVTFNIRLFSWADSSDITNIELTDDLLIVPPIFEVGPNKQQVIRIAARPHIENDQERAYRLLITEVPPKVGDNEGVNLNYRISMPVFLTPVDAKPNPIWNIERGKNSTNKLTLKNLGDAHLFINAVRLAQTEDAAPVFKTTSGGAVFSGEQRSWPLDINEGLLTQPLILTAETERGPIEALVSLPRD